MRTGGQLLVDLLAREGVRYVFTVPGESFLSVLDALHGRDGIAAVVTRNEAGAAMMAEASGKLTGRPGVVIVSRGPGAANALAGVYVAAVDRTPMLLIVGLAPRSPEGLPKFQDIDAAALFGSLARRVIVAADAATLPALLSEALREARLGSGPVVLAVPEDVFAGTASVDIQDARGATEELEPKPEGEFERLQAFLAHSKRPIVIAGSLKWSADAAAALAGFAEMFDLPVATAFRRQDRFDNRHRCYVGHLGLASDPGLQLGVKNADLIIALGDCLDAVTTADFSLLAAPRPAQQLLLVAHDVESASCPIKPTHRIQMRSNEFAELLSAIAPPQQLPAWGAWRRDLRSTYLSSLIARPAKTVLNPDDVIAHLVRRLPADAIVCNGAGNYAAHLHRAFVYKSYPTQLAPRAGSMGYGLPAAIAAKLAYPGRPVIALAGDGCFQMTGQELATAVQFALPIVTIVFNNSSLGSIKSHQERRYPGRIVATTLTNPDFVALAQSYGALGLGARTIEQFSDALESALAAKGPSLIELGLLTEAGDDPN